MLQLETWKHVGLVAVIAAVLLLVIMTGKVGSGYSSDNIDQAENPAGYWAWVIFLTAGGLALGWAVMTGRLQLD